MQFAYFQSRPLTSSDAVQILGAVYRYLRHGFVAQSMNDYHACCAAQGEVLTLRESAFRSAYPEVKL